MNRIKCGGGRCAELVRASFDSPSQPPVLPDHLAEQHGMDCEEEYICEMLAAFILFPPGHSLAASDTELAREYEMLPAHIRFRRLIDHGYSHLLGEVMSPVRQAQQEGNG